jgi:hypothetical protein
MVRRRKGGRVEPQRSLGKTKIGYIDVQVGAGKGYAKSAAPWRWGGRSVRVRTEVVYLLDVGGDGDGWIRSNGHKKMCEFTRFLASYVETLDETKVFRELWLGKWKNSKP